MDAVLIILLILAIVLALVGVLGAFLPGVPGPPLSLAGLYIVYFVYEPRIISPWVLVVATILTLAALIFDYVAPIWLTKLGGGSRYAMWGSTIGIVVGMFYAPWGLIMGPLLGAFIGEMIVSNKLDRAVKVALMSFVSFLLTTGLKFIVSLSTFICLIGVLICSWVGNA